MTTHFTRRQFARFTAAAAATLRLPRLFAQNAPPPRQIASGPFKPTWESLTANYKTPEWFRDAKFGMWAHWTAQCVPEQGDWYARNMYIQGNKAYDYHVKTYGHPSKVGFMEIDNIWKAEKWDPERLIGLYKRAGAKYFFAMGAHHDNFDMYDSAHHDWNSLKVGPKKDLVDTWAKIVRAHGLRFGLSNHNSWAARWLQPAYGYDGEGPLEGVRYDAYTLTKADGKGKWWEGLDPQDLYTGNSVRMPNGIPALRTPPKTSASRKRAMRSTRLSEPGRSRGS
jgi:alpha-L-fucosidase